MAAIQPALDGTLPQPAPKANKQQGTPERMDNYEDWIDRCRPSFERAADTGEPFTTSEIQQRYQLPDPPDPAHNWGHLALRFKSEHLIREWSTDRSKRKTANKSRVAQWIGTPKAERSQAA